MSLSSTSSGRTQPEPSEIPYPADEIPPSTVFTDGSEFLMCVTGATDSSPSEKLTFKEVTKRDGKWMSTGEIIHKTERELNLFYREAEQP